MHRSPQADERDRPRSRTWSWAALTAALVIWAAGVPTWGLSLVLAPVALGLSVVAARRSPRDGVFWIGLTLNALLMLGFVPLVADVLLFD